MEGDYEKVFFSIFLLMIVIACGKVDEKDIIDAARNNKVEVIKSYFEKYDMDYGLLLLHASDAPQDFGSKLKRAIGMNTDNFTNYAKEYKNAEIIKLLES